MLVKCGNKLLKKKVLYIDCCVMKRIIFKKVMRLNYRYNNDITNVSRKYC